MHAAGVPAACALDMQASTTLLHVHALAMLTPHAAAVTCTPASHNHTCSSAHDLVALHRLPRRGSHHPTSTCWIRSPASLTHNHHQVRIASAPAECAQDTLVATTPTTCMHAAAVHLRALRKHLQPPCTPTPLPPAHRSLRESLPSTGCLHPPHHQLALHELAPSSNIRQEVHPTSAGNACCWQASTCMLLEGTTRVCNPKHSPLQADILPPAHLSSLPSTDCPATLSTASPCWTPACAAGLPSITKETTSSCCCCCRSCPAGALLSVVPGRNSC
jgi:hypothetical protein